MSSSASARVHSYDMPLIEVLVEPEANDIVLASLPWRDCLSLASVSTRVFTIVKTWAHKRSTDVSYGASPHPIPCDSACEQQQREQQQEIVSGHLVPSSKPQKWCIGGPLPPNFLYLNEVVFPFGAPDGSGQDMLGACSCRDVCLRGGQEEDGATSRCSCVRLNAAVQSGPAPLFECHASCSCSAKCPLRATQKGGGRTVPRVRLRYMGQKGWGAYPADPIQKGAFVADYTGEVLSVENARQRVPAYDRDGSNYVLTTQEFFQGGKQVCRTVVDATTSGNVSRFFNHSCEPTLSVFVIRRGSFQPRLAFFTNEFVPAGCELTYDYGAAGAAGGAASLEDDEDFQPDRKAPRKSSASVEGAVTADGSGRRSSPGDAPLLPLSGVAISSDSGDVGSSADGKSDPLRRPCLCGARRCRVLLPCNRAIL